MVKTPCREGDVSMAVEREEWPAWKRGDAV
jgi:hypothetical protein